MIRFALRGMLGRKLRTALTAIGIVLGVALVSGTYVLTDSISSAFDSIFTENYKNTDAAITGKSPFELSQEEAAGGVAPPFDQSLLAKVQALPEVEVADGSVFGEAQLIGRDGKAVVFGGAPNLALQRESRSAGVQHARAGRRRLAGCRRGRDRHADRQARRVSRPATRSGCRPAGRSSGCGSRGWSSSARCRRSAARRWPGSTWRPRNGCSARRASSTRSWSRRRTASPSSNCSPRSSRSLPDGTQVRSAEEQATEDAEGTSGFLDFFRTFLLVFAGIALFVGSFVIANSLSITIAQRTREFATLRTLGASRRQVLGTVVLEALVTGLVAAVAGLFLGLGVATGLFRIFDAVGLTLPNNGLVFRTRTIVVGLLVGVLVTLVASLRPAWRATRVPPIAAVREGATLAPGRFHRFRPIGAALLAVAGVALVLTGLFADGLSTTTVLSSLGLGVLLIFIGIALFSARLVRPLAVLSDPVARWSVVVLTVLVWPLFSLPYWLLRRGLWGPGPVGRRTAGFVLGAVLNPVLLLIVALMAITTPVQLVGAGVARGLPRRTRGPARDPDRRSEQPARSAPDGVDRRRADDRAGPGHPGRDARSRHHQAVRGRGRQDLQRRLRRSPRRTTSVRCHRRSRRP